MLIDVYRPSFHISIAALLLALCSQSGTAQTASPEALLQQGNAAMRRGDAHEAASDFAEFTRKEPRSAAGFFNLGLALEQDGRLEDSLTALHKAEVLQPGLRGVRLFTGIVAYKLNHLPEAHDALARLTASEPKNSAGWMWLGIVALAQNQPDAAATALDKAAALDPNNQDILYHRGRAHLLVSKESYSAMFKLDPNSWRVHEVVAQADAEAFRTDSAIGEFRLAIHAAPSEPGLHEELGDACWTAGKLDDADAAYAEEIKIDPVNATALYKLGSLRVTRNQAASGVPLLDKALALAPTLNDIHYYLGKGEVELGNNDLAMEQFRLATSEDSAEELKIMSWYQLAMLYRGLHRTTEATAALATFRQMKSARDLRQESNFQAQEKRYGQLPVQEKIPDDPTHSQP